MTKRTTTRTRRGSAKPRGGVHREDRAPFGTISRPLWIRPDFKALTDPPWTRALYVYLKTCPPGDTCAGVFPFHAADAHEDLGVPMAEVEPALCALEDGGFIRRDGRYVWIIDYVTTNPGISLANPKHLIAIKRALSGAPPGLAAEFYRLHKLPPDTLSDTLPDTQANAYANPVSVSVPVSVPVPAPAPRERGHNATAALKGEGDVFPEEDP